MASKSVPDMITAILKRINVVPAAGVPSPEDSDDVLEIMNDWVASVCGLDRLAIYTVTRTTWTIVSTKGYVGSPYTVGVSGDINIARPVSMEIIERVNFQDTTVSPTLEYPLTPLTLGAYSAIPQKTLTSPLPSYWFYEPSFTSGAYGSLYLWLVPTQSSLQGVIYTPTSVSEVAITDTFSLPPGYNRFIRDNVAVECWTSFREGVALDPVLAKSASDAMAAIKRTNQRTMDMGFDSALTPNGVYNIYSDL